VTAGRIVAELRLDFVTSGQAHPAVRCIRGAALRHKATDSGQ
jgi:hypothetical protein